MLKFKEQTVYLVAYFDPLGINTIVEQIYQIRKYSKYEIKVINLFSTIASKGMVIPDPILLKHCAGVIIHPTTSYFPENLDKLLNSFLPKFRPSGPIIVYKQDEHVKAHETARILKKYQVDVLLTCVPESEWSIVYPKNIIGECSIKQVFTGYVSDELISYTSRLRNYDRKVDLFYRGSKQPPQIGRLGFEKYSLPRWAKDAIGQSQYNLSASSAWEDRLNGSDWLDGLASSKMVLGNESGSNCFDFDGNIEIEVNNFLSANPLLDPYSEEGYKKLHDNVLNRYEGNVNYGQIAPRHLEAVATKTCQLLLPGCYSGLFKKNIHYLELEPKLANLVELIEHLRDPKIYENLTNAAYEEILLDKEIHYQTFVKMIDEIIESNFKRESQMKNAYTKRKKVLLLVPHLAHLDPRIAWWQKYSDPSWDVLTIESSPKTNKKGGTYNHEERIITTREHDIGFKDLPTQIIENKRLAQIMKRFWEIEFYSQIWKHHNLNLSSFNFSWGMDHINRISIGLIEAAMRVSSVDLIISVDFPSLPAGAILKKIFQAPLVYDAQEIWYQNLNIIDPSEIAEMTSTEEFFLKETDLPITVSSGLAEWYLEKMGIKPSVLPNFGPYIEREFRPTRSEIKEGEPIKFIFLGQFAPERGIDKLIEAWDLTKDKAILTLQGPENDFKNYCRGLVKKKPEDIQSSISFPPAVSEEQLISTAAKHHVGIIPYTYKYPYSHCSPNKLTQYMNAGLMVLSHELPFVTTCLDDTRAGLTVNFNSEKILQGTIHKLTNNPSLINSFRNNINDSILKKYSWEESLTKVINNAKIIDQKKSSHMTVTALPDYLSINDTKRSQHSLLHLFSGGYSNFAYRVGDALRKRFPSIHKLLQPLHRFALKTVNR